MAAVMRSVRRLQQVLLVPRICVTGVRAESGGKGLSPKENIKTLVSFPVKVSYFQQAATGENRDEPFRPVTAPLLDVGGPGGQSDTETQLGQDVSHSSTQSTDRTSHKDDSFSSSSSDSSSDSESEDNEPFTESSGEHKRVAPAIQKSSFSSGHMNLEKESPKDGTSMTGENARDIRDPVVTTEEQSLHPAPLPTKTTLPGADKIKILNARVPTEDSSATTADHSGKIKVLPTSEVTPTGAVETSQETQLLSSSEKIPEGEMLAPKSGETHILSTTTCEGLPAEVHESCSPPESGVASQESFDNTKYQNLQHFTYTPFTFVDVDVELAKYRLPQPSSGRPSPRH